MGKLAALSLLLLITSTCYSQQITGPIKIHQNNRHLATAEGNPFFWLADTAWELFHRCDAQEAEYYLDKRKSQGFNVVQAVVLAELDGVYTPNANGDKPFVSLEKTEFNEPYFAHVDLILDLALDRNIHIALLPTWGDKLYKDKWGIGPELITPEWAYSYGKWIGTRYKDRKNVIWILGGDRNPRANSDDVHVWNEMAKGIIEVQNPQNKQLISFHPQPSEPGGSSNWFHQEEWLDFNLHQTGHCPDQPTYMKISHDLSLSPLKPSIDGEPLYEEHPKCFNAKELGYSEALDIRRIMYWNVFAGAAGQTYGCHAVWQMYTLDREPVNAPLKPWNLSLDLEMANQMKHLKNLILSRDFFSRIPDQRMIVGSQEEDDSFVSATRSESGDYAMIYFPTGKSIHLDLSSLKKGELKGSWYDPRTGATFPMETNPAAFPSEIIPPSQGRGNDWVLVLDTTHQLQE